MRRPRRLSPQEAELWARLAQSVAPLHGRRPAPAPTVASALPAAEKLDMASALTAHPAAGAPAQHRTAEPVRAPVRPLDRHGLDGSWERKLSRAEVAPDFTLDLHGHGLDAAHSRLDHGLTQAVALGARMVLLITGRPRPAEAADRGDRRGAIRAKVLDWLAAGPHASRIAAVRPAHRKHGGAGALYIVLRRAR